MQENLNLYHIFYVTAKAGNISRAAKELYISQPAISKAVKKLESSLDTVLFKRSSRGVTLTPSGEMLFEKVSAAFSLLTQGETAILQRRGKAVPRLRLGASSTLVKYVLLSYLTPYVSAHPKVRISISTQDTYQTLKLLEEDKIDMGLIAPPKNLHGFHFRPVLHIRDTFVATRQYLDTQRSLYPEEPLFQTATFMMLDAENISRQSVNAGLREHHLELTHILEVTSMDLLIEFAKTGLGIGCVVREFVQKELESGILVEVPTGIRFPEREIGFVCRKKEAGLPLLSCFFE